MGFSWLGAADRRHLLRAGALVVLAGAGLGLLAGADVAPPKLVTIQATTMPRDHFVAITKATGVSYLFWPESLWLDPRNEWSPVKIAVDKKPFWEATREVCRAAGLTTNVNDARADRVRIWKVKTTSEFDGPCAAQAPFLIVANMVKHSARTPTFATLDGRAFIDPGTNVYAYTQGIDITSITDDKNSKITGGSARLTSAPRPQKPMILPLFCSLQTPAEMGTKVSVKGSLKFVVATSTERVDVLEFQRATYPVNKTLAGMAITVNEMVKQGDDRFKFSLTVHRGTYSKDLWSAMAASRQAYLQMSLAELGGRVLPAPDILPPNPARIVIAPDTMPDPDTIEYRYEFSLATISDADGNKFLPTNLIFEVATGVQEVTVPVNLADIPVVPTN